MLTFAFGLWAGWCLGCWVQALRYEATPAESCQRYRALRGDTGRCPVCDAGRKHVGS